MCVISTLCLQLGKRLGFWGGFSCFGSFIRCQLFACLIVAAIFRLPPPFVVWPFFLCHGHLWSVLSFFAIGICVVSFTAFSVVGIRVRLFVFALLAFVSGYQCISQFLVSYCALLLVSFILGDLNWIFFQIGYPVDSPINSALKQTPFGIPP